MADDRVDDDLTAVALLDDGGRAADPPPAAGEPAVVAFVGPSLPPGGAPDGIAPWPPAQRGDVLRALAAGARTLVVVDGYFHSVPAVSHQELRYALACGVRVIGAASMGALRAAEMAPLGMEAVGDVAAWYRDGALVADDEVALLHGPAPEHRPLTVPLVEVRAALGWRPGRALDGAASRLVDELARWPYVARDPAAVEAAAARLLGPERARELAARLRRPGVKAADAALAFGAALAPPARPPLAPSDSPAAGYLCAYLERYLTAPAAEPAGVEVALGEAWAVAALLHPGAAEWLAAHRQRLALAAAALHAGERADAAAVAAAAAALAAAHGHRWGRRLLPPREYRDEAALRLLARQAARRGLRGDPAAAALAAAPWWTVRAFAFSPALGAAATVAATAAELRDCFRDWSAGRVAAAGEHRRLARELWGCADENVAAAAAARGLAPAAGAAFGLRHALDLLLVAERLPRAANGYPAARRRLVATALAERPAPPAREAPAGESEPASVVAAPGSTVAAAPAAGLGPLAFLVGGVWVAACDPRDPTATIEERCTWAPDRRSIATEVVHRRRGAVVASASGAFEWDEAAGVVRSWSRSTAGAEQRAVQLPGGCPGSWVFVSARQAAGPAAASSPAQVTITHAGPDEMLVAQQAPGAAPVVLTYRRRGA